MYIYIYIYIHTNENMLCIVKNEITINKQIKRSFSFFLKKKRKTIKKKIICDQLHLFRFSARRETPRSPAHRSL